LSKLVILSFTKVISFVRVFVSKTIFELSETHELLAILLFVAILDDNLFSIEVVLFISTFKLFATVVMLFSKLNVSLDRMVEIDLIDAVVFADSEVTVVVNVSILFDNL
jgi:hypothetical protein